MKREKAQAVARAEVTAYGFLRSQERRRIRGEGREPYASPSVSNIAALMASDAVSRPRPRTGTRGNSARRHGWRRPAWTRIARSRRSPARQHKRLPVHDHADVVQMSKWPIHNCSLTAAISRCTPRAARRDLHVERAGQMQRLDLGHPGEGELIVGPVALGDDRDFILAGALERPVVIGAMSSTTPSELVREFNNAFEEGHAVSTLFLNSSDTHGQQRALNSCIAADCNSRSPGVPGPAEAQVM